MNVDQLQPKLHLKLSYIDYKHETKLEAKPDVQLEAIVVSMLDVELRVVLEVPI